MRLRGQADRGARQAGSGAASSRGRQRAGGGLRSARCRQSSAGPAWRQRRTARAATCERRTAARTWRGSLRAALEPASAACIGPAACGRPARNGRRRAGRAGGGPCDTSALSLAAAAAAAAAGPHGPCWRAGAQRRWGGCIWSVHVGSRAAACACGWPRRRWRRAGARTGTARRAARAHGARRRASARARCGARRAPPRPPGAAGAGPGAARGGRRRQQQQRGRCAPGPRPLTATGGSATDDVLRAAAGGNAR